MYLEEVVDVEEIAPPVVCTVEVLRNNSDISWCLKVVDWVKLQLG